MDLFLFLRTIWVSMFTCWCVVFFIIYQHGIFSLKNHRFSLLRSFWLMCNISIETVLPIAGGVIRNRDHTTI